MPSAPIYNGNKRSLTCQVVTLENGVEVSTNNYNGLAAFTWDSVDYPTITSIVLQALTDEVYAARLAAFEAFVEDAEGATIEGNIQEGFEAVIADGTSCPIPAEWADITVIANVDAFGLVSGGATYLKGAVCTITATPKATYKFDYWQWSLGGVAQTNITESTYEFVVSDDAVFTAVFSFAVVTTYTVAFSNHVCQII